VTVSELPPKYVTRNVYARMRGVSFAAVDKAIHEGRMSLLPGGLVDPEVADREWDEKTGPERGRRQSNGSVGGANGGSSTTHKLYDLKALHEQLKLELTQAELDEKRGNLVDKGVAAAALEEEGRRLRDAVLQVPVQVAAALAACGDPQGCRLLVHGALREALKDCAGGDKEASDGRKVANGTGRRVRTQGAGAGDAAGKVGGGGVA
jgi:hypothetical protein